MKENSAGRRSFEDAHKWDASFEVQNAYAEVKKCCLFHHGKWQRGLIHRVSMHGAALVMKKPFECGDKVELIMHLAAYGHPVHARGIVVRNREKPPYFEVGVEFVKIRKEDAEKFDKDKYLENLLKRRDSELI